MHFSYPDEYVYPVTLRKKVDFFKEELNEFRTMDKAIKPNTDDYYRDLFRECDEEYFKTWM